MHCSNTMLAASLLLVTAAIPAAAQRQAPPPPTPTDWAHGSTVSVEAGLATASDDSGASLGVAVGWELAPRLMVEGSGRWVDRPDADSGFNAALKVRAGLRRADVSPFVEGGLGLYRVSTTAPDTLPDFYARRVATGMGGQRRAFTDPTFHVGGGVSVFVSRRLALQPSVEAMMARDGGRGFTTTVAAIRATYHFEDHPVTPSRSTR
jgi:hypothetical protein